MADFESLGRGTTLARLASVGKGKAAWSRQVLKPLEMIGFDGVPALGNLTLQNSAQLPLQAWVWTGTPVNGVKCAAHMGAIVGIEVQYAEPKTMGYGAAGCGSHGPW